MPPLLTETLRLPIQVIRCNWTFENGSLQQIHG
jgi:hypothetical protein